MKLSATLLLAGLLCAGVAVAQDNTQSSAKQDMKDAGHATADAGKDVGHATAKGAKTVGHATKSTTKKVVHSGSSKTQEGSQKAKPKSELQ